MPFHHHLNAMRRAHSSQQAPERVFASCTFDHTRLFIRLKGRGKTMPPKKSKAPSADATAATARPRRAAATAVSQAPQSMLPLALPSDLSGSDTDGAVIQVVRRQLGRSATARLSL